MLLRIEIFGVPVSEVNDETLTETVSPVYDIVSHVVSCMEMLCTSPNTFYGR